MERIDQVHEWKKTYDITIKGKKGSGAVIHSHEEREPYPPGSLSRRIQSMKGELNLMQALIKDVQMMNRVDAKVQVWAEEISGISLEVENLINLCTATQLNISPLNPFKFQLQERIRRINQLKEKIQRLHNRTDYGIEHIARTPNFVEEIKARLLMNCQDLCIFPILGVKDNDKANLQELFNDYTIIRHFDVRVYVSMPQESNAIAILEDMATQTMEQLQPAEHNNDQLSGVGDQEEISWSMPILQNALRKAKWTGHEGIAQALKELLSRRRFLIVFHDVQNVRAIWSDLQQAFPNSSNGSRIVFSAQRTVESTLELLSPNLDSQLNDAADQRNKGEIEISNFQLQAPIRLRESLADKRVLTEWEKVVQQLNNRRTPLEAADVIYENIPGYLRQYLYYFLLFPKDFKIPARRLIALWVAEGIAKQKRGEEEPAEHVAESYLNEMVEQNVVQVTKTKLNGKVKLCQLYDGTRKWLEKAAEAHFFKDTIGRIRRLVDHLNEDDMCHRHIGNNIPISPNSFRALYGNVLSFLSFDTQEGSKPGEDIGCFLSKCISYRCFRSLRVLDLEKVFRPKLPTALRALRSLRYLGLRWTYLEELPSSISKLLNLLVLDLKHTYISTLPESIWKMQYLRHLYLSETYRSRFPCVPRKISLSKLQTLWGAFIDEDSPVLEGLNTLKDVKKLGLSCRAMSSQELMNSQLEAVGDWIVELKQLESLRLKSFNERGDPSYLYL